MNVTLRRMTEADLDTVMDIERGAYSHPWRRGHFSDSLQHGHECWIAERDRRIVGYGVVMCIVDEVHLLNISVRTTEQRQGLGRQLMLDLLARYASQGATMMFLEVRESNTPARRLYESVGFNDMAIRRNYYPATAGRENAI